MAGEIWRHWPHDDGPIDNNLSHMERLTGQTGSVGAVTLLTAPPAPGLYDVDILAECILVGVAGTLTVNLLYTGVLGATVWPTPTMLLTTILLPTGRMAERFSIWITGGDIAFSTTVGGLIGSPQYNVTVRAARALSTI